MIKITPKGEKNDYYSTPTEEVLNILQHLNLNFTSEDTILDPGAGGGHMIEGIREYSTEPTIYATDIIDRNNSLIEKQKESGINWSIQDFLSTDYSINEVDYIIMNPPFKLIEPFLLHSFEIANKGILMLGRLQFLEGQSRYKKIFSNFPPTDTYVYIDRISCHKNGDTSKKESSAQAYAWFYWDYQKMNEKPLLHWIHRIEK